MVNPAKSIECISESIIAEGVGCFNKGRFTLGFVNI